MDMSKVLFDCGPLAKTMMGHDLFNPIHLRYTVKLDHEVDGELLKQAWDKTKRVYPIIDAVLKTVRDPSEYMTPEGQKLLHEHLYLYKADGGSNDPVRTKVPITPGTPVTAGRIMAVSYYGNEVTINTYHTIVDGGGLSMVFGTLLYTYLALYTGHEDERPIVELTEGRDVPEYYQPTMAETICILEDYTPTPMFQLPYNCVGFNDEDMVNDGEGPNVRIYAGSLEVPAADFMRFCKANGSNPSSMICALLAEAAYALNPDEQNDIVFGLTTSVRKMLGIEHTIANAVGSAVAYTTREDVETKPIAEVAQRIRADVDSQRNRDYYISQSKLFNMYEATINFKVRTITYVGTFSIGDNDSHICGFSMETNGDSNLYLMQVRDKFILTLQYGRATAKYLDEFVRVFQRYGIEAQIVHPAQYASNDTPMPVL